jgi:copper(I)-binding protein
MRPASDPRSSASSDRYDAVYTSLCRASRISLLLLSLPLSTAVLVLPATMANAHSYKLGSIDIGHLWAKPSTDGSLSVLGPLFNNGTAPDELIGAASAAATSVIMHANVNGHDRTVSSITLPPAQPVSIAPWADEITLDGVRGADDGAAIPLTLTFAHAGSIDVDILIQSTPSD